MLKTIKKILGNREVYFVREDQTVLDAVKYMSAKNVGAVPVLEGDHVVGIFSERDLMKRILVGGKDPSVTKVADVMTKELIVVDANESWDSCLKKMKQGNMRHLPVISEDRLVGVVSLRDLLLVNIDEKEEEIKLLNAYIHYIPPSLMEE